jgi:hypothetical protein
MQDHEAESPKKVGSAGQNREVTPTPMVDCNEESIIEESYSLKKKTEHLFCVIKKSTNAKEAEPKSNEPDSNIPVSELGSASKNDTTKNVVNAKKKVIERPKVKRRKKKDLPILMETIINREVYLVVLALFQQK